MAENKIKHSFYLLLEKQLEEITKPQYELDNASPIDCFGPISRINVFVGSNNSGKSRFMRALIQSEKVLSASKINAQSIIDKSIDIVKEFIEDNESYDSKFTLFIPTKKLDGLFKLNEISGQELNFSSKNLNDSITVIEKKGIAQINKDARVHLEKILLIVSVFSSIEMSRIANFYNHHRISQTIANWRNIGVTIRIGAEPNQIKLPQIPTEFHKKIYELADLEIDLKKKQKNIYTPLLRTAHSVYSGAKKLTK